MAVSINSGYDGGGSCGGWRAAARHSNGGKRAATEAITRPKEQHRHRKPKADGDGSAEGSEVDDAQLPDGGDGDRQLKG